MRRLFRETSGAVAVYGAVAATLAVGAGAVAVDLGRLAVLKSQMQDRADAGALAGATQLDFRVGAQDRASQLAIQAISQESGIPTDQVQLSVSAVNFYSVIDPDPVAATDDADSVFIEVVMEPRRVDFVFAPILAFFADAPDSFTEVQAVAVARPDAFICHSPPLMLCDPAEADPSLDLSKKGNFGRQFRLKEPQEQSSPLAPGNFGLLSLPDGSSGAQDIRDALAAVVPADCQKLDVITAPGSKTNQVKDGINARFDLPDGLGPPAPDVINYPRDANLIADPDAKFGSGLWDANQYWLDKHGVAPPIDFNNEGWSRYQVYLYELGEEFARKGGETIYPVDPATLPGGFTTITPPAKDLAVAANPTGDLDGDGIADGDDPDYDGVPSQTPASNGPKRRLVQVAVLQCIADNVQGKGTYPTTGNFVEVFITEEVRDPPEAAIYAELVRPVTNVNEPNFHANVRLVR